jgi:hypothetical protein
MCAGGLAGGLVVDLAPLADGLLDGRMRSSSLSSSPAVERLGLPRLPTFLQRASTASSLLSALPEINLFLIPCTLISFCIW